MNNELKELETQKKIEELFEAEKSGECNDELFFQIGYNIGEVGRDDDNK